VAKHRKATPTKAKVIGVNMLNFKPIFDTPLKNCKGTPISGGRCDSKTLSFSTVCKNLSGQHPLEAKIWSSQKGALGGHNLTFRSPRLLE